MDLHRCAGSAEICHLTHNNEAKSEIYSCMLLPANEELISVLLIALWNISGRIITAVQKSSQTMLSHGMFGVNLEARIYYAGLMILLFIFITFSWKYLQIFSSLWKWAQTIIMLVLSLIFLFIKYLIKYVNYKYICLILCINYMINNIKS